MRGPGAMGRPAGRGAAGVGASGFGSAIRPPRFRLIILGLFALGMLAGCFFRGSPTLGHPEGQEDAATAGRRELHLSDHTEATAGVLGVSVDAGRDTAHEVAIGTDKQHAITTSSSATGTTGSSGDGSSAHQLHEHDARHPDNVHLLIKGQSHHEDQPHHGKETMLQSLMHGHLHELLDAATGSSSLSSAAAGQGGRKAGLQRKQAVAGGKGAGAGGAGDQKLAAAAEGSQRKAGKAAAGKGKQAAKQAAGGGGAKGAAAAVGDGKAAAVSDDTKGASAEVAYGRTAPGPGCKGAGKACGLPGGTIHTLFTSNGSPYQNFQARIMVATWHLVRKAPGGSHLVAMTRILHRTTPDELMDEVDTFRAEPLQPECDKWCWFPVADRANAVQQWINATVKRPSLQKAPWLLLLETDYVWIKPLPAPGDAYDPKVPGLSFAFDYIGVRNNHFVAQMLKDECPSCDAKTVPNSGPAPVLARFEDFQAATPLWEKLSLWIETHEEVKKGLGWVREMYAWDIGVAASRLNILNQGPPHTPLIAQPPHDHFVHNATMYHYTWGSIFKKEGKDIWKFDKRTYTDPILALRVPRIPLPPPWEPGVLLHDGQQITKDLHAILSDMLTHMNLGIDTLPDLTKAKKAGTAAARR